jgi:hypothetical protein
MKTPIILAILASGAAALPKISRHGRYLYSEDGSRFFIKGISYQEAGTTTAVTDGGFPEPTDFTDPLSVGSACIRDVPFLQQLTVNAVRVYSVDSRLNHDNCMAALEAAGIYTIIDLSLPVNGSINRASPAWSTNLLGLYTQTIDAFSKYNNVLAYNIGNEIVTKVPETNTGPFIKAAARDIKAYLKSKGSSALVGYASTDGSGWRDPLAAYLSCGSEDTSLDLYGLNNYRWCGDSTFAASYAETETAFKNYNIPAYFSEYGCNTSPPRVWTEVAALFGPQMTDVWSGGLAFSYFPTVDNFGLVTIDGNTVTPSSEFQALKTQLSAVTFATTPSQSAAGATQYPTCAAPNANFLGSNTLPPTPNANACDCLTNTAFSCIFTPKTTNTSTIIGQLLDYGCSSLPGVGGSCAEIGADGAAGTYGKLSYCDPPTKLSYVMTEFYELSKRDGQTCNYSGNASIVSTAPSSTAAVHTAEDSCLSGATGVFTPAPVAPGKGPSPGSGNSKPGNGALNLYVGAGTLALSLVAGVVTLIL